MSSSAFNLFSKRCRLRLSSASSNAFQATKYNKISSGIQQLHSFSVFASSKRTNHWHRTSSQNANTSANNRRSSSTSATLHAFAYKYSPYSNASPNFNTNQNANMFSFPSKQRFSSSTTPTPTPTPTPTTTTESEAGLKRKPTLKSKSDEAFELAAEDMFSHMTDMEHRTKCRHIVDSLMIDPRVRLPFNEYIQLCTNHSLSNEEALQLSKSLHECGLILYFDRWFEEERPLLIKAKEITRAFLSTVDLEGDFRYKFIEEKHKELKKLLLQIKPLEEIHQEIDMKSRRFCRNCWRSFFGYVVIHCMAVPYLTFWAYSWDIMEPVTYMFNLWTLFLATWFYLKTNFELSNEGISEAIRRMKRQKLYVSYHFDLVRYESLQQQIADIEDDLLNPEWQMLKEVHPSLPDTVRNIHLTPDELLKKFSDEQV